MNYRLEHDGRTYEITLERDGPILRAMVEGQTHDLEILDRQPGVLSLRFDGRSLTLYWAADGPRLWVSMDGCTYCFERPSSTRRPGRAGEGTAGDIIRAPMPAQVRTVQVSEGETVQKGQTLLLLEAMKMEIRIKAPAAGKILKIMVKAGQTVDKEQTLAQMGG